VSTHLQSINIIIVLLLIIIIVAILLTGLKDNIAPAAIKPAFTCTQLLAQSLHRLTYPGSFISNSETNWLDQMPHSGITAVCLGKQTIYIGFSKTRNLYYNTWLYSDSLWHSSFGLSWTKITDTIREDLLLLRFTFFSFFWHNSPQWAKVSSFTRFLDHTQRRTTACRTPLDKRSDHLRHLPDKKQHSQQTDIHAPGGIRTHNPSRRVALERAANGTGLTLHSLRKFCGHQTVTQKKWGP